MTAPMWSRSAGLDVLAIPARGWRLLETSHKVGRLIKREGARPLA
jgi:hypothetical protein